MSKHIKIKPEEIKKNVSWGVFVRVEQHNLPTRIGFIAYAREDKLDLITVLDHGPKVYFCYYEDIKWIEILDISNAPVSVDIEIEKEENMREIKFRGKGINGEWYYGLLSKATDKMDIDNGYYISNRVGMPFAYPVRPETITQYTGLKDKKGKEIYEGDIVKIETAIDRPTRIEVVKYSKGYFYSLVEVEHEYNCFETWDNIKRNREVIGNKFDNPELKEE